MPAILIYYFTRPCSNKILYPLPLPSPPPNYHLVFTVLPHTIQGGAASSLECSNHSSVTTRLPAPCADSWCRRYGELSSIINYKSVLNSNLTRVSGSHTWKSRDLAVPRETICYVSLMEAIVLSECEWNVCIIVMKGWHHESLSREQAVRKERKK